MYLTILMLPFFKCSHGVQEIQVRLPAEVIFFAINKIFIILRSLIDVYIEHQKFNCDVISIV